MDARITICLLIFLFMIVSFSLNRIPMALTSFIGLVLLVVSGCVDPSSALNNIGSNTVITMIAMFVVASGFSRTQMVSKLTQMVYRISQGSFTRVLASYVFITFLLGQFIPSITALFALICPLVINMCDQMHISPSKMIYSIALVTVAASFTIIPIGPYAASFIEDNGYLAEYGISDYTFTIFTQMFIKIPVTIFVLIWAIFFAPRFAPEMPAGTLRMMDKISDDEHKEPLSAIREVIGYGVFVAVITGLTLRLFDWPSWIMPSIGALVLVLSGVLSEREAIDNMHLDIIILYVGVATLGSAFENTGAGDLIGDTVAGLLSYTENSYMIGAFIFAAGFLITTFLYNRAVSKVLIPLVIVTSMSMDCDPRGLMVMCYISSMCSLITPMSTSVVPMMMAAGGYDQKSLIRMGILPSLIMGIIAVAVGMTLYPCY